MNVLTKIASELFYMIWDIYWGLALGFILSSLIRAFISTESISSRLGKDSISSIGLSTLFGAVSSSCSYAAASMARALMIKGATWSNAVAFMVASTNLVFEIFIVIVSLLGWSFFGGEVIGGIFFIIISAILIRWIFPSKAKEEAKAHIEETEGKKTDDPHAHHMTNSCCEHEMKTDSKNEQTHAPVFKEKLKEASGHFYMDVMMVGKDILIGLVVASILMVLVPEVFWKGLFLTGNSSLPHILVLSWNAVIGVLIAIVAFVCSVGNIVMAAVLWQGGISFGGVIAFILADLVTIPMLMVFRKYYGNKTMWYLLIILVVSIFFTSLFLDYSFEALKWIPKAHNGGMQMANAHFQWNYATWLNIFFIPISLTYFYWGKKSMK
ncbi:MAG: permease [Mucilaginibacter sp.]